MPMSQRTEPQHFKPLPSPNAIFKQARDELLPKIEALVVSSQQGEAGVITPARADLARHYRALGDAYINA